MDVITILKVIGYSIVGFFTWFLGSFDGFLIALCIFVVVDYLTGIIAAIVNKELSSEIGWKGISKKVLMFLLVGISSALDVYILKGETPIREIVIVFYVANEGISIIENSAKLGLPIPTKLINILKQLKNKGEDTPIENIINDEQSGE